MPAGGQRLSVQVDYDSSGAPRGHSEEVFEYLVRVGDRPASAPTQAGQAMAT